MQDRKEAEECADHKDHPTRPGRYLYQGKDEQQREYTQHKQTLVPEVLRLSFSNLNCHDLGVADVPSRLHPHEDWPI